MKALTLKQPLANMIVQGKKTIETRMWRTNHRGWLLITSSKKPDIKPAGHVLAVVYLGDCRPMVKEDEKKACYKFRENAHAWIFHTIYKLKNPFPVRGYTGFFNVDYEPKVDELKQVF